MEPVHYFRAVRTWWMLIAALTAIGFFAALLSSSASSTSYSATHTLARTEGTGDDSTLARAAFVAGTQRVKLAVAKQLGVDPGAIGASVQAVPDATLDGLHVTATASGPKTAERVADAYAEAVVADLDVQATALHQKQVKNAQDAVDGLQAQLASPSLTPAARDAISAQYDTQFTKLEDLKASAPPSSFETIQQAVPYVTSGETSTKTRVAVGTVMGALLGIVAALVLARFDTRIRTREQLETKLELPVLAEIPLLRRRLRSTRSLVTKTNPESLAAESFRSLRTALLVSSQPRAEIAPQGSRRSRSNRPSPAKRTEAGRVVLIVSPGSGEAKTTTSANLAVAFAESGRKVLLVGADLRRPQLHEHFGIEESPGLSELLRSDNGNRNLASVIRDTEIPRVQIVTSGAPVEHPGELLSRGLNVLRAARQDYDVVLVDTAPLLATDDAGVLMPLATDVVLLCRAGRTPLDAAERAKDLLVRLEAPLNGGVLVGSEQLASARAYYRSYYRSRHRTGTSAAQGGDAVSTDGEIVEPSGVSQVISVPEASPAEDSSAAAAKPSPNGSDASEPAAPTEA